MGSSSCGGGKKGGGGISEKHTIRGGSGESVGSIRLENMKKKKKKCLNHKPVGQLALATEELTSRAGVREDGLCREIRKKRRSELVNIGC